MSEFHRGERFLGMSAAPDQAQWVVFGIPMDFTASLQPGSRFGPPRIREASWGLETFSVAQGRDLETVAVYDAGDLELPFGNVPASLEKIGAAATRILEGGQRFLALGGEHLVSLPLVAALVKRHPDLVVMHWDAHADLRMEYAGEALSHATVLRRVSELIAPGHLWQFGIRSGTAEEVAYARREQHFYPHEVLRPLEAVWPQLVGRPIYFTMDIDVIDPAFLPGTGTPEPGGISAGEALLALQRLQGLDIVSMDVVETMPLHDHSQRSALLAAKIVREALLAVTAQTAGGNV